MKSIHFISFYFFFGGNSTSRLPPTAQFHLMRTASLQPVPTSPPSLGAPCSTQPRAGGTTGFAQIHPIPSAIPMGLWVLGFTSPEDFCSAGTCVANRTTSPRTATVAKGGCINYCRVIRIPPGSSEASLLLCWKNP